MSDLLTFTQYAAHRGCSQPYVSQLVKAGRIPITPERLIDPVAADAVLDASQDPARGGKVGRQKQPREAPQAPATESYTEVRTEREKFTLKAQEVEYRRAIGELVEREAYNRGLVQNLGPALQRIDTVSARLGARLAAETDVRKVQDIIDDEMNSIRQEVADNARAIIESAGKTRQ